MIKIIFFMCKQLLVKKKKKQTFSGEFCREHFITPVVFLFFWVFTDVKGTFLKIILSNFSPPALKSQTLRENLTSSSGLQYELLQLFRIMLLRCFAVKCFVHCAASPYFQSAWGHKRSVCTNTDDKYKPEFSQRRKHPHLVCLCPQQRYDDLSVVVPNHPPEVLYGARQRILGNDELTALPVALQEHDRGSASDLLLLFTATVLTHCTLILVKHIYPTHANT